MAQSSTAAAAAATAKHNGFALKFEELKNNTKTKNNNLASPSPPPLSSSASSSSPRRTAIGKPSLRLSIPTIEQIAESSKSQPKLNQTIDPANKKTDSFVKRMIDNCNHSGQLPSNLECTINGDSHSNSENAAEICDTNRVKSVVEKLDKNKRMSNSVGNDGSGSSSSSSSSNSVNGKSPTTEMAPVPATDDDKEMTIKLSIDDLFNDGNKVEQNNNNNINNKNEIITPADTNECSQLDNFPSYSTFENDFKRRINELNSSRSDQTQTHGITFYPFHIYRSHYPLSHFHFLITQFCNHFYFYFYVHRSHTIIHTNEDHFVIDTKHTIVAHTETPPQQDCQPEPIHSLQIRTTYCKCNLLLLLFSFLFFHLNLSRFSFKIHKKCNDLCISHEIQKRLDQTRI